MVRLARNLYFFRIFVKCVAHKLSPKVDVEEFEAQNWTAWGWDIIKIENEKSREKKTIFFSRWHFSKIENFQKVTFFQRRQLSKKDVFWKSDFWKFRFFFKSKCCLGTLNLVDPLCTGTDWSFARFEHRTQAEVLNLAKNEPRLRDWLILHPRIPFAGLGLSLRQWLKTVL